MGEEGLDYVESSGSAGVLWGPFSKQTHSGRKKKKAIVDLFSHVLAYTNIKSRGALPRPCS